MSTPPSIPASSTISPQTTDSKIPTPLTQHRSKPSSGRAIMQSLISRGKAFLTPTASSTNLPTLQSSKRSNKPITAKTPTQLFPITDPAIDGEDCLHDCASCTMTLPRKWEIDEKDTLYGHVNGWDTHVIVATGKTDWVRDIEEEKGSLMEQIGKHGLQVGNGKVMLSASDMPTGNEHHEDLDHNGQSTYQNNGRTRCLVLPRWSMVEGISRDEVPWLMDEVVGKSANNTSPLPSSSDPTTSSEAAEDTITTTTQAESHSKPSSLQIPHEITLTPCPHLAVILLCSHKTRDWRCGASAPLLRREFERHLRTHNLYRDAHDSRPGGVGVYFINHVGGHKYSANVMVYRRSGAGCSLLAEGGKKNGNGDDGEEERQVGLRDEAVQGVWLARVRPEDCENIVRYTVLQGKVVKPERQLRGGFDRGTGMVSW